MFSENQPTELNVLLSSRCCYTFEKIIHWKTTKGKLTHLAPNVDLTTLLVIKPNSKVSVNNVCHSSSVSTTIQCFEMD